MQFQFFSISEVREFVFVPSLNDARMVSTEKLCIVCAFEQRIKGKTVSTGKMRKPIKHIFHPPILSLHENRLDPITIPIKDFISLEVLSSPVPEIIDGVIMKLDFCNATTLV
jgi:hypothetical protein